MNFLSMKYFCAVEKARSITRAAESLYITQQTLSAHIASIEKEAGCRLFVRSAPLELTYAGTVFLGYAKQFERLYLSMEKEFADIRAEESGVLRVGIAHTRGQAIMPDLITRYQSAYPKMGVELVEDTNSVLRQKLLNREVDVIIAGFPENIPEIESRYFFQDEVVLLVSRQLMDSLYGDRAEAVVREAGEGRGLSALAECPFLLGKQEDLAGRIGRQLLTEAAFIPRVSAQANNIPTLLALCIQGSGACFYPELLVQKILSEQEQDKLYTVRLGEQARYQIRLGWLRQPYCWQGITNFVRIALEEGQDGE